jgi:hypothetical protein
MTETSTATTHGVALLASHRFFVRRIPLLPVGGGAAQVELALEGFSPFPLEQLYHGYVAAPAQDEALVFAAYRKQFAAAETAGWGTAAMVVPALVALLENPPAKPLIRVWRETDAVTVAAWDGRSPLPGVVLSRPAGEATETAGLVAEARIRAGLATADVEEFSGTATGAARADGRGYDFTIAGPAGERRATLGKAEAATADVRDKVFLAEQRRVGRRDQWLGRAFLACVVGCGALLVAEAGLLGGGWALRQLQAKNQQQAAGVEKIMMAQSLSERIEELGGRRLMPLEMLAALNRARPASVVFLRAGTTDRLAMEVEAQTGNAADVGVYEAALRAAPAIATVETRDLRSREGTTSFVLAVTFKPGALQAGGQP